MSKHDIKEIDRNAREEGLSHDRSREGEGVTPSRAVTTSIRAATAREPDAAMKYCLLGIGLLLVLACGGRWLIVAHNWLPDDEEGRLRTARAVTIYYEANGKRNAIAIHAGPELDRLMSQLRL